MPPTDAPPAFDSTVGDRENVRCNFCRADNFDVIVSDGRDRRHHLPGEFRMVRCRECGLIYLNPRPTASALMAYHPPQYSPYTQRGLFGKLTRWLRQRDAAGLLRSLPARAAAL